MAIGRHRPAAASDINSTYGAWWISLRTIVQEVGAEAVEEKPSLQSQIKSYEATRTPVDPRAQHFVEWYTKEYGEAPPQELIDRAATTFMVSGESTEVEAPEKSLALDAT